MPLSMLGFINLTVCGTYTKNGECNDYSCVEKVKWTKPQYDQLYHTRVVDLQNCLSDIIQVSKLMFVLSKFLWFKYLQVHSQWKWFDISVTLNYIRSLTLTLVIIGVFEFSLEGGSNETVFYMIFLLLCFVFLCVQLKRMPNSIIL